MSWVHCSAPGCPETIGGDDTTDRAARMMARRANWTAVNRVPFRCPTHRLEALNALRATNGLDPLPVLPGVSA